MRRVAASGRSRGGPAPYFQTKLWPERVKQYYFCFGDWAPPLSKGLDDQPPLIWIRHWLLCVFCQKPLSPTTPKG